MIILAMTKNERDKANFTTKIEKKPRYLDNRAFQSGGGTGIRTLEGLLTLAGFQDQCFQPLSHPSAEDSTELEPDEVTKVNHFCHIKNGGGPEIRTLEGLQTLAGFQVRHTSSYNLFLKTL